MEPSGEKSGRGEAEGGNADKGRGGRDQGAGGGGSHGAPGFSRRRGVRIRRARGITGTAAGMRTPDGRRMPASGMPTGGDPNHGRLRPFMHRPKKICW